MFTKAACSNGRQGLSFDNVRRQNPSPLRMFESREHLKDVSDHNGGEIGQTIGTLVGDFKKQHNNQTII